MIALYGPEDGRGFGVGPPAGLPGGAERGRCTSAGKHGGHPPPTTRYPYPPTDEANNTKRVVQHKDLRGYLQTEWCVESERKGDHIEKKCQAAEVLQPCLVTGSKKSS